MNGGGGLTASLNGVQTGLTDKAVLERRPEEMAEQAMHLSGENVCGTEGAASCKGTVAQQGGWSAWRERAMG